MPPNNGANIQPSWLNKLGQYYSRLYYLAKTEKCFPAEQIEKSRACKVVDYPARSGNELFRRAIFAWPWNENARTKPNSRERFDWFIERIQTRVAFGWLPENYLGQRINRYFAFTSYCNTVGQSNNAFSIFFLRKHEEAMFWCFHSLADKTNKEHLPKPFCKVIQKSLYMGASFLVKSK